MRTLLWVGTAIVVAGCAGGSRVSPVRSGTIAMNSEVTGVLAPSDARLNDGSVYQGWRFYGTQGQMVQIDVMSDAFDAFAILEGPAGNEIARDDDTGGRQNARINVSLPVTGTYRIIANTYRQGQFGRYRVRLASTGTAGMPVQPVIQPIVQPMGNPFGVVGSIGLGQQAQGVLSAGDARWENKPFQAYQFACNAGQTFQLDVLSSWDNYGLVFDPIGNVVARDDDSGDVGLNARIVHTCAMTGMYRLAVTAYSTSTTPGAYTLTVR